MKDIELECLPAWRYCQVRDGEKIPFPAGWQNNPLQLAQIATNNLGLLLGPRSGGVVALDFDGASAWTWFESTFGIAIPPTVMWTSGKDARCQMAFAVHEDYWPLLRTQKIPTGEGEGFEFRWDRTQSIMPPSCLADGRSYTWIATPSTTDLIALPEAVLDWWVLRCNPEAQPAEPSTLPSTSSDDVVRIYEELKRAYPTLNYDRWSVATWIITRELGQADGLAVMKYLWPPVQAGDYDMLFRSQHTGRTASLGTVIEWIRELNPGFRRPQQFNAEAPTRSAIQKLRKKLKEMY